MTSPIASSSGIARAMSASPPPAMIVSVPSSAFGDDPVTGASTNAWPRSASAAPIRRASAGPIVDMSTNSVPGPAPPTAPSSPSRHRVDLGAVDHHRDHDVAALGDLARRRGDVPAVLGRPLLGALAGAVVDRQLEAGAAEAGRLARPHDPQPDEPDGLRHDAGRLHRSGGERHLLGLGQVLVRRAVAVLRQRRALTGGPARVVARHSIRLPSTS